ncbi:ubiquitin thioesterase OTUB1 isoform X2 [Hydra vulgaris]|uniref:Ubiquitin thioesterase n=1 Tax=Hydra vulgaris TaxID=6087 RepID=A0ABM4CI80_HYDVU
MAEKSSSQVRFAENIDLATIEQVRDIEKEISTLFPLVGELECVESLLHDYASDDQVYQNKLKDLFHRYSHLRRTRGDGNCFYRAFGFKTLETCLVDSELLERLCDVATSTKNKLVALGYSSYTVEDFHETFMDVLEIAKKEKNLQEIIKVYNEQGYSDYFVVFLRLMVSCYLQENEEFYSAFIEGHTNMKDFCSQEVEPMAKESDHIHIIALTNILKTTVQVEYMDRGGHKDLVNHHNFPDDGSKPAIYLLYRPGHYDILYPREET